MMTIDSGRRMSNLQTRIITGILLGCIVLALTWAGGRWFAAFSAVLGGVVFYEWNVLTAVRQNRLAKGAGWVCYAVTVCVLLAGFPAVVWLVFLLTTLLLGLLAGRDAVWVSGGYVYSMALVIALSFLREYDIRFVWFLFAVVWGTDISAYFCGRAIGGPKLAPRISPKKTWSGAIGGVIIGVICGVMVIWMMTPPVSMALLLLAPLLSVVSQLGDLGESWIKRYFDVKDSGNILPGHGGVMDRVDGLVAAAAVFYLVLVMLVVSG